MFTIPDRQRKTTRFTAIILSIVLLISTFTPVVFGGSESIIFEHENNDTRETAQEIDITWEGWFFGQLIDEDFDLSVKDTDVYTFTVPKGTTARLFLYSEDSDAKNTLNYALDGSRMSAHSSLYSHLSEPEVYQLPPDIYYLTFSRGSWDTEPENSIAGIRYDFVFELYTELETVSFGPENGSACIDMPLSFDRDTVICGALKLTDAEEEIVAWSGFSISLKDESGAILYEYNMSAKEFYDYCDGGARFYSVYDYSLSFPIPKIGLKKGNYHLIAEIQNVRSVSDDEFSLRYLDSYKYSLTINKKEPHYADYYYPKWETEPNNRDDSATSIENARKLTCGTFADTGDKDWFVFECDITGAYSAYFRYDYEPVEQEQHNGIDADIIFKLYDQNLEPISGKQSSLNYDYSEDYSFPIREITLEQGKKYYISLEPANTENTLPIELNSLEYFFNLVPYDETDIIIDSGTFAGADWTLTKDGTLTFSGPTGMKYMVSCVEEPDSANDFSMGWTKYAADIKKIVMENGFSTVCTGTYVDSGYSLFFEDLPNLEAFEVSEDNKNIKSESGVLYTKDGKCLIQYPAGHAGTEFTVPDTVAELACHAFESATLTKIVLPDGIEEIPGCAFRNCGSLSDIDIPQSVKSIGYCAFYDCASVKSIELPDGLESIGSSAFEKTGISEITIPDSVVSIDSSAFADCAGLRKITFSRKLKEIPYYAAGNCPLLEEVSIPYGVIKINDIAFADCTNLKKVNMPDSVEYLGRDVFINTSLLKNAEKTDGVIYFDGWVLDSDIEALPEDLVIDDDTFGIASETFSSAKMLKSVVMPDCLAYICDRAFSGCDNLGAVKMPTGLKTIGYEAFCDDISLKKMAVPVGVAAIGARAFFGCDSLRDFVVYGNPEIEYGAFGLQEGDDYYDRSIDGFLLKCLKDSSAHKYAIENDINVELLDESDMLSRAQKLRQAFDKDSKKVVPDNLAYMIRRHGEKQEYTDNYKASDLGVKTLVYTDTDNDGEDELLAFEIVGDDETHVLQLRITGYDIDENGKLLTAAYEPRQFNNQHALYEMEGGRENFIGVENGYIVLLDYFSYDSADFSYFALRFENGEFTQKDLFATYAKGAGTEDKCTVYLNGEGKAVDGIIGSDEIRDQIATLKEKTRETLPDLTLFPIDDNGNPRIYDENGEWNWSRASLSAESVLVLSGGYENKDIIFDPIDADLGGTVFAPVDRTGTYVTYNTTYGNTLLGDVTSARNPAGADGHILAADARLVLRASASLETLNFAQKLAADVNRDGNIHADDARQILRFSAKLQQTFENAS